LLRRVSASCRLPKDAQVLEQNPCAQDRFEHVLTGKRGRSDGCARPADRACSRRSVGAV
jgi:hypothetical protein